MEFKGTKGKWEIEKTNDYHEDCRINHIPNIGIFFDEYSDIEPEEIDANLLLISKAPEMLEMLEELAENLSLQLGRLGCCGEGDGKDHRADNDSYGGNELLQRTKQLIKEATEI